MNITNKLGDLRVWHVPQIPGKPFHVSVSSAKEAVVILRVLAEYDLFQLKHNIKPDYCNAQGLEVYEDNGEGPEWCEWYDETTGDDIRTWGDAA